MDRFVLDGHKLFWHLERVAQWQRDRLVVPIYLEISPVSYCNHNCVFCGLDFAHGEKLSLDAAVLVERVREMARMGVKSVMYAGEGEPLLHPRLTDIVRATKEGGIDVSITTNGMAGNRRKWEEILPHLSWIRFSIDAAGAPVYSRLHGVPEKRFETTLASLREAVATKEQLRLPVTIGVQFLLLPQNLDEVEEAVRLYQGLRVDYLSFKPYSEHPQMRRKTGFSYTPEVIESIEERIKTLQPTGKTTIVFRKAATAAYAEGLPQFSHCHALPFWGYISSAGDFYTCSVYLNDDRFKVGNIHFEGMEALLRGERRRQCIRFAERELIIGSECRVNCRMARINEFLDFLVRKPEHINFI